MSPAAKKNGPMVLPVGGGKGGIGKSMLAANLGLALARLEHRVALIDADLGGSDLHNLLGLENDLPGLGEFLTSRGQKLPELVHPLKEPRLGFLPGDAMVVATANPSYQQKRKLLTAIKKLPHDFVILDLGAGTAITVMDLFLCSPLGILVMLPERPAMLSAFNFLKNAVFRSLERVFRHNSKSAAVLARYRRRSRGPGAMRMAQVITEIERAAPGQGKRARQEVERWRPKLVLNRVRGVDDFALARQLTEWAAEDLGLKLEVAGFLPEDQVAGRGAAAGRPALDIDPAAPFCRALAMLAQNMGRWAGDAAGWAASGEHEGSFNRAVTGFAPFFPPPGDSLPTREELIARLQKAGK